MKCDLARRLKPEFTSLFPCRRLSIQSLNKCIRGVALPS